MKVYSTVRLCKGARGELSLFTVPQGQYMPMLTMGASICPHCNRPMQCMEVLTKEHTNITRAGECGTAIGDVVLKRVRAVVSTEAPVDARFELRVSGDVKFKAQVAAMLGGLEFEPIPVARTDCFEGRLYVDQIDVDTYLRVEFE